VHLVTRGHFRSRYKDGGHTIRSAVVENPMLHANLMAVIVYRTGVMDDRSLLCEKRDLDLFSYCDLNLDP